MPQAAQAAQAPQQPQELTQTATIRNAVNLKKNTLKLVPLSDSPGKFSIHFVFDASTPCRYNLPFTNVLSVLKALEVVDHGSLWSVSAG